MVELKVTGMTCGGCVSSVERVVRKVPGVTDVKVTLEDGRLVVDGGEREAVVKAVEKAGFKAD